ncbi:hypothetical protein ACE6H2_000316 [Prunus campanulata]
MSGMSTRRAFAAANIMLELARVFQSRLGFVGSQQSYLKSRSFLCLNNNYLPWG